MLAVRLVAWLATLTLACALQFRSQQHAARAEDQSECPPLGLEPPDSCASQRVAATRSHDTHIVITSIISHPNVAELVRHIEYHFLLRADLVVLFDTSCPSDSHETPSSADSLEVALRPYIESNLVILRTQYRCDLTVSNSPGNSGLALKLLVREQELHQEPGTLILSLDPDEYVVMANSSLDLLDLRSSLLHAESPLTAMRERLYGSSGFICQPTGSIMRHFTKTLKLEETSTDGEKAEAIDEAKRFNLHMPYGQHSQAFMWTSAENMNALNFDEFEGQAPASGGLSSTPELAFVARFGFQSEQHWAAKRATLGESSGPVPERYNQESNTQAWTQMLEKIESVNDAGLRTCLAEMFGPKPDSRTLYITSTCKSRSIEKARCGRVDNKQPVRIAVGFYGAQRSTPFTVQSIEKNLFEPLMEVSNGALDVFVHAMLMEQIDNTTRTGQYYFPSEAGMDVCPDDLLLLNPCVYETHWQNEVDRDAKLPEIAAAATWDESGSKGSPPVIAKADVRLNILRSRWSMKRLSDLIASREQTTGVRYTHAVMARADVGFATPVQWQPISVDSSSSWLRVSNGQHWRGLNDRFAYGERDAIVDVLLKEFDSMNTTNAWFSSGSEVKLCEHVRSNDFVRVGVTPMCIVRVRATGEIVGPDMHYRGDPKPTDCRGLNFYDDEQTENACAKVVDGAQLAAWGWKRPNLDDVLQFIHIPETGSKSLDNIGLAHGVDWGKHKFQTKTDKCRFGCSDTWQTCSPWHIPLQTYHKQNEIGKVSMLHKTFCVVRDPFQRAISQYAFAIQSGAPPAPYDSSFKGRCDAAALNEYIQSLLGDAEESLLRVQHSSVDAESLGEPQSGGHCTTCAAVSDCHWLPQWLYVFDANRRQICDNILRYENLEADFDSLIGRFAPTTRASSAIPPGALREQSSKAYSCNTLTPLDFDERSREILRRVYAEDFRLLDYDSAL